MIALYRHTHGLEAMVALSAFDDKARMPESEQLEDVLRGAARLWNELISRVGSELGPLSEDWTYSGKKWGWALRLKHGKRAVLYMTPSHGVFFVGFALGEKAVAAAHEGSLSRSLLDLIDNSQKFAEGRAVRLEVRDRDDLGDALQIVRIKMAN